MRNQNQHPSSLTIPLQRAVGIVLLLVTIPVNGEAEGECVLAAHTAQNDDEEAAMANNGSGNNIAELPEFMLEGADLNAPLTNDSAVDAVVWENIKFGYKTTKLDTLKELAKEMGVQYTGAKKAVWNRIISSGHLRIISLEDNGQSFTFC